MKFNLNDFLQLDPKVPETPVSPTTIESGTFAQITDGSYADNNRSYVIDKSDADNNIHNIVQIQTFTVYKK